jgi:hypothetical protein
MANPTIIRTAAGFVILGAAAVLWFHLYGFGPAFESRLHRALGEAVAEEAAKLLGDGGRLILIDRDTRIFKSPATVAHLRSFHQALSRSGRATAFTNVIKVDPLRLLAAPPGDFFEILRRTSKADVVVSFLGPPVLSGQQIQRLGEDHARVVAFCPGTIPARTDLKGLFRQNLVHVAIIDRPVTLANPADSAPLGDWFDRHYETVTRDRLEDLLGEGAMRR